MSRPAERWLTIHSTEPVEAPSLVTEPPIGEPGVVDIHFARLTDLLPRMAELEDLLDPQELARADRFRFRTDRERYVLGHGFTRERLSRYVPIQPQDLTYAYGPFGKPLMSGGGVAFNVSDTKDAVAVAISASGELGLDLETMTRRVDHVAVGEHYFTSDEQAVIGRSEDGKRAFLEFWTRKEAVLKASGVGIMDDLRILRTDARVNRMRIAHPAFIEYAAPEYHVRTWWLGAEHIISLAVTERDVPCRFLG